MSTHLSRVDTELGPLGSRTEHINAPATRRRRRRRRDSTSPQQIALPARLCSCSVAASCGVRSRQRLERPLPISRCSARRAPCQSAGAPPSPCRNFFSQRSRPRRIARIASRGCQRRQCLDGDVRPRPTRGLFNVNTREVMPSVLSRGGTKHCGQGRRSLCASGGQFRPVRAARDVEHRADMPRPRRRVPGIPAALDPAGAEGVYLSIPEREAPRDVAGICVNTSKQKFLL